MQQGGQSSKDGTKLRMRGIYGGNAFIQMGSKKIKLSSKGQTGCGNASEKVQNGRRSSRELHNFPPRRHSLCRQLRPTYSAS